MKAVLLSIRPNWCKLIWSGMKTVEVRKTRPKLETPFKVYVYCTGHYDWTMNFPKTGVQKMNGKVICEFTCDRIERVGIPYPAYQNELGERFTKDSCLSYSQLHRYAFHDDLFFWHISGLKVYDKPKPLSDFSKHGFSSLFGTNICGNENCEHYEPSGDRMVPPTCDLNGYCSLRKASQSWCYVEELRNGWN